MNDELVERDVGSPKTVWYICNDGTRDYRAQNKYRSRNQFLDDFKRVFELDLLELIALLGSEFARAHRRVKRATRRLAAPKRDNIKKNDKSVPDSSNSVQSLALRPGEYK